MDFLLCDLELDVENKRQWFLDLDINDVISTLEDPRLNVKVEDQVMLLPLCDIHVVLGVNVGFSPNPHNCALHSPSKS